MASEGPKLIVCEKTGAWAAALRSELAGSVTRVVETRSFAACREELSAAPAAVVAWELAAWSAPNLSAEIVARLRERPAAHGAVLAGEAWKDWEWLLREAGGLHFVTSPRRLAPVAELARRSHVQRPAALPGIAARILAELPWG